MIFLLLSCMLLIIFDYLLPATFKLLAINLYLKKILVPIYFNKSTKCTKSIRCLIKNAITKSPINAINPIIKRYFLLFDFSGSLFNFICLVLFFYLSIGVSEYGPNIFHFCVTPVGSSLHESITCCKKGDINALSCFVKCSV